VEQKSNQAYKLRQVVSLHMPVLLLLYYYQDLPAGIFFTI